MMKSQNLFEALPNFPRLALRCLEDLNVDSTPENEPRSNFGGRLGFHLLFYYWNSCFTKLEEGQAVVDAYFDAASSSQRYRAIRDVGRVFSQSVPKPEDDPLFIMVCEMGSHRLSIIGGRLSEGHYAANEVHDELAAFVSWLECECFPFEWRVHLVNHALKLMEKPPKAGFTVKALSQLSADPAKLHNRREILERLILKEGQIVSWSYREGQVKAVLERGLGSKKAEDRQRAQSIQDVLLKQGLFE